MEEEIERFACEAADGSRYTVVVIQQFTTHRPVGGAIQKIKTMRRLELADGSSFVNYIDDGHYKIVRTDTVVRRI